MFIRTRREPAVHRLVRMYVCMYVARYARRINKSRSCHAVCRETRCLESAPRVLPPVYAYALPLPHARIHACACILHTAHCTLHTAHCTLHTTHCVRTLIHADTDAFTILFCDSMDTFSLVHRCFRDLRIFSLEDSHRF